MSQRSLKSFRAYAQRLIEQRDPFDPKCKWNLEVELADMKKYAAREYRDHGKATRAYLAMEARIKIMRNVIDTLYPEPIAPIKYAFVNENEPDEYIHLGEGDEEDIDLDEP